MSDRKTPTSIDRVPDRTLAQEEFVQALAVLLAGPVVPHWSIGVQLNDPLAKAVADVRSWTGLFGYPSTAEAEVLLRAFLWGDRS